MDIEHALKDAEAVDWATCKRLHAELVDEMAGVKPILKHYVDTRVIP
jgi:hypothetical protein